VRSPRRRLRPDRLAILAVALSLLLASVVYYVIQRGKLGDTRLATDKTLLAALAATMVVLALALGWMTVRNLARVITRRRLGVLGSRLQARVAFAFLFLILIPTLILFGSAIAIVRQSLKDLASPDLEGALRPVRAVAEAWYEEAEEEAAQFARQMAEDLDAGALQGRRAGRGELASWLREALQRYGVDAVGLVLPGQGPLAVAEVPETGSFAVRSAELTHVPEDLVARVLRTGRPDLVTDRMAVGWRAVAAEPARLGEDVRGVVWSAVFVPEQMARELDQAALAHEEVVAFQQRRVPVQRLYVALFALITLLVLFAAVWTGFYLASQVTRPVLELARGTAALAQGDLSFRVRDVGDDEIGRLASSFNHMADEIERHRRAVVARRRYIETLLEAVPVGVLSIDPDGRVSTANRAALEVLRLAGPITGTSVVEALGPGREAVARVVEAAARKDHKRVTEEVPIQFEGGEISVAVTVDRFGLPGRGAGILVVIEDLTQLRRAERVAAWGEVARRVAHEIKNPLTPIRLSAERMVRRYRKDPERFGEVLEESVATIVREVDSLRNLVAEFSRFARLPEIRPGPADLGEVAAEAIALYRDAHPDVEIDQRFDPDLPAHRFDREAIRRSVINLLENAVAAAGTQGRIQVTTCAQPAHGTVVLEVTDDGPGIPEEDRRQLFLPTFSRRPGGTGLGLAIVHRIVADHGGRIRAEDAPDGGTRMIIELPATVVVDEPSGEQAGAERVRD
jgi:two-component system nitrogen regulation sensor histidine kinase NtrY